MGSCVVWCVEGWGHVLFVGLRAGVMCLVCWGHVFGALRAGVMCCLLG